MAIGDLYRDVRDGSRWQLVADDVVFVATGVRVVCLARGGARKWIALGIFKEYFVSLNGRDG